MTKTFNELLKDVVNNYGKVIHYNMHSIVAQSFDEKIIYLFTYGVRYHEGSVLPDYYLIKGKRYVRDKREEVK